MKKLLLNFTFILCLSNVLSASNYYWVGGSGKWSEYNLHWATSSGGNTFHVQVPTNLDNVYFDANSGFTSGSKTITIDQTIVYCNDMNWTGATNNPSIVTLINSNVIKIFGSLTLINAMNFSYTGDLNFEATNLGKTIASNDLIMPCRNIYFNGIGGGWFLSDSLTVINGIYHNAGTINTNSQTITVGQFYSSSNNIRSLNISGSRFKVKPVTTPQPGIYLFYISPTNITFNASNSVIQFLGSVTGSMGCTGLSYNDLITSSNADFIFYLNNSTTFRKVTLLSNSQINGEIIAANSATIDSLVLTPGKTFSLRDNLKISTSGALVANGTCSNPISISSVSLNVLSNIIKAGAPVVVSYVSIKNVKGSGGATFTANNSINLGNTTGWNFTNPTPRDLYWIGGTGMWSDITHWSASSGGVPVSGCIPYLSDNVNFDANSGFTAGSIVTMDKPMGYCNSMNWSGALNNPTFNGPATNSLIIDGSLTFNQNMTLNFLGDISFISRQMGNTITSANKVFKSSKITFDGIIGGWNLVDSLSGTINTTLNFYAGEINTNNQNINIGSFNTAMSSFGPSSPIKLLTLNNSRIIITASAFSWNTSNTNNLTIYPGTSTILMTNSSKAFLSNNYNYYNVISSNGLMDLYSSGSIFHKVILAGSGSISGNNRYDSLVLSKGGQYTFEGNSFSYFLNGTLVTQGTCSLPVYLQSSNAGQPFIFTKSSGTVTIDNAIIRDNIATGGATYFANNSFATPEVIGWTINQIAPRALYWVGGTGIWDDSNHWSTTSGGTPSACIPWPTDNVFFDANSFPATGAIVTPNGWRAFCKNMDWTGSLNNPTFKVSTTLEVFGDFKLISGMSFINYINCNYDFSASGNMDMITAGQILDAVNFVGPNGVYNLQDDFNCGSINLRNGTFNTNNNDVSVTRSIWANSYSIPLSNRAINLGSSTVTIGGEMLVMPTNFTFDAGTSTITFTGCFDGTTNIQAWTNGLVFHNVVSTHNSIPLELDGRHHFNKLTLLGPGIFNSNCTFDTLILSPGRTYNFHADSTQYITANGQFDATGTPGFPIELLSTTVGTKANISKPGGNVCLDYLFLKDMNATGGAQFFAGINGANVANNSGWVFTSCSPTATLAADDASLSVFPIPADLSFNVETPWDTPSQLTVVDITGRKVLETSVSGRHNEINIELLPSGIYNLIIYNGNNSYARKISVY